MRFPGQVVRGLVVSARPPEWVKNTLVFAAILFSGRHVNRAALLQLSAAFAALCLAASASYLFNDVRDLVADRLHPTKGRRPIAAGIVAPRIALGVAMAA